MNSAFCSRIFMLKYLLMDSVDLVIDKWKQERPELDPAPMGIVGRISRACRILEQAMEQDYRQFGLTGADFDVLATLRRSGPSYELTPTMLYRTTMLSSGAMTNRLDRLERLELIRRRPDPGDRRGTLVSLTPEGREKIDSALDSHLTCERQLIAALNAEEQEEAARLLRKLLFSLETPSQHAED